MLWKIKNKPVEDKITNLKAISEIALIAAIYITVSLVLAGFSFGVVQIRIAEALTIMAVFKKRYIYGLTLGCFLTNLIGFAVGQNILGIFDSIFGTLATLLSGYLTYYLRNYKFKNLPILSTLPPVIINAIVVGGELTILIKGRVLHKLFFINALSVGVGQFISCCLVGIILFIALKPIVKTD